MEEKKISFIANAPLSSNKISIYQTLCQAQSIGKLANLTLMIPKRSDYKKNIEATQKIKEILNIREDLSFIFNHINYLDLFYFKIIPKRIRFSISSLFFSIKSIHFSLKKNYDVIFTRDIFTLLIIYLLNKIRPIKQIIVFESHQYSPIRSKLMNCVDILLVINQYQLNKYNHKNAYIMHDAVWEKDIEYDKSKLVRKSIFYCGSCGKGKGINRLISLAKYLEDYQFKVATLEDYTIKNIKKTWQMNNINWLGRLTREELFDNINSAEYCILPNDPEDYSNQYSSPMKLFEYMSKGKALILSDIPTVREILNKDDYIELPKNIVGSNIRNIINKSNSNDLGKKSFASIKKFTWEKRAERFINLININ
tara:strand:- start:5594 stop:6694 length:1101 start_codon:yes stop_codon:yes gene_type:complete